MGAVFEVEQDKECQFRNQYKVKTATQIVQMVAVSPESNMWFLVIYECKKVLFNASGVVYTVCGRMAPLIFLSFLVVRASAVAHCLGLSLVSKSFFGMCTSSEGCVCVKIWFSYFGICNPILMFSQMFQNWYR